MSNSVLDYAWRFARSYKGVYHLRGTRLALC